MDIDLKLTKIIIEHLHEIVNFRIQTMESQLRLTDNFSITQDDAKKILINLDKLIEHFQEDLKKPITIQKENGKNPDITIKKGSGYCIKCGCEIAKNRFQPLCDDCQHLNLGNHGEPLNFCHICGRKVSYKQFRDRWPITIRNPLCSHCHNDPSVK